MEPTVAALARFPRGFEAHYRSIPAEFRGWAPASWDGFDGERFTGIEHLCHVRDIEVEGYRVRFRRALSEENPTLDSIDGYELARSRNYSRTTDSDALESFRTARQETLQMISALRDDQLSRPAVFEGSPVTVRGLIHHLCKHDYLHLAGVQWLLARIDEARSE
jgi:hypothetical protein